MTRLVAGVGEAGHKKRILFGMENLCRLVQPGKRRRIELQIIKIVGLRRRVFLRFGHAAAPLLFLF